MHSKNIFSESPYKPDMNMLNRKNFRSNSTENIFNLNSKNFIINNIDYDDTENLKINEEGDIEENHIEEIRKNLHNCENTLPGYMISVMLKKGHPISEDLLLDVILPKINDLRKPDGSKYKVFFYQVKVRKIF